MWIDGNGVAHTVALPNSVDYVNEQFLHFLYANRDAANDELFDALEDRVIQEYLATNPIPNAASSVGQLPPDDLEIGSGGVGAGETLGSAVASALAAIEPQWRLDAVMILVDVTDNWR